MRVGVLSDTHDRLPLIEAALKLFREQRVAALLHAGDLVAPFAARRLLGFAGPLYVVYGNNDGEREGLRAVLPQIQDGPLRLALDDRAILMHHSLDACESADVDAADIVITGHTHDAMNRSERGTLLLNPGECCGWVTGRATVAVLDTRGPSARVYELNDAGEYPGG